MNAFPLQQIQAALHQFELDGWLLYDFRGINSLARQLVHLPADAHATRRWAYWIPVSGEPVQIVHRIEDQLLSHLPGSRQVYSRWQELEAALRTCCAERRVAMEYSPQGGNPYISRVDAGTVELIRSLGGTVVSSGNLIQLFEARWSPQQWQQHLQVSEITHAAYELAWNLIAQRCRPCNGQPGPGISEQEVAQAIVQHFQQHGAVTDHPPIVARNEHSGRPHYETGTGADTLIRAGDFVLIDLWAKLDQPEAVFSDLTRVACVSEQVPQRYADVFQIVAAARDQGLETLRTAFRENRPITGAEVDDAVRGVIEAAGYGAAFTHRTGHSIGTTLHGNGAHLDNFETREDRLILPGTCFSVEPGIYLNEFGIRLEVDVFVTEERTIEVTGGLIQSEVIPLFRRQSV